MALISFSGIGITALSAAVPRHIINNYEYTDYFPLNQVKEVVDKVGVFERRFADENTCSSDLCYAAAEKLIIDNNLDRNEIDLLVFLSQTPDYRMPATSIILQHRLRLPNTCVAFDIQLGCAGFSYAVSIVYSMMQNGNFKKALILSDAFWELRSDWLHRSLGIILIVIIVAAVLLKVLGIVDRKTHFMTPVRGAVDKVKHIPILSHVGWCFTMMRNPFDCSYGIKKEKRSSLWAAAIIVVLFFILQVANKYASGFLFKTVREGEYELLRDAVLTFGAFILLTVCCYLVCTINDGEARFRDIVIGSAAALTPMIIALPIRLILSNVVTFNEEFFLTLLDVVAYGFTGILIVLALMYLNDYSFKKTIAIIVITLFTVLVTVALLFVVYVLIGQLIDFVSSIYGEVVYRFVRKV